MSKEWIDRFTYSINPRNTGSSKTYYREVWYNIRKGGNNAIHKLRGQILTLDEVIALFEGYANKVFDHEYTRGDISTIRDIIRLTYNHEELDTDLYIVITKLDREKEMKRNSEPRIKSIW